MTTLEELLAAIEELKATLLNAIMAADCSKAMERWLEMEVEPDRVVAAEPEVRTVEIGGQLFRVIVYPLGSGGRGGC